MTTLTRKQYLISSLLWKYENLVRELIAQSADLKIIMKYMDRVNMIQGCQLRDLTLRIINNGGSLTPVN